MKHHLTCDDGAWSVVKAYLCCNVEAVLMPWLPISSAWLILHSSSLFSSKSFSFSSVTVQILSFS